MMTNKIIKILSIFFLSLLPLFVLNSSVTKQIDPLSLFLKETKILYDMNMNQRGYGKYRNRYKHHRSEYRSKTIYHRIKNGENLSTIAKKYRTRVSTLIKLNKISSPNKIYIGQRIKVKAKRIRNIYKERYRAISKKQKNLRWPLFTKKKRYKRSRRFPGILIRAKNGENIRSAGSGKIVRISTMRGYGKYIIIAHGNHLLTVYSSLGKIKVKLGQRVNKGVVIAKAMKKKSNSLRFQVAYYGRPVNPLKFLII